MAKQKMKAVRMEGKVVGYVGKDKYGLWRSTDAKRKSVMSYLSSRDSAVYWLVRKAYDVDTFLENKTKEAIARMDKKRIQ